MCVCRKIDFTIGALTVDPQVASYDPSSLIPYMQELNVEYIYKEVPIFANAQKLADLRSICSYCSRMKRGIMYSAMRENKWNVLALGFVKYDFKFDAFVLHGGSVNNYTCK